MSEKILTALDIVARCAKAPDGRVIGLPLKDAADFEQLNKEAQVKHGKVGRKSIIKVAAYVSDNRWVADCPNCNAGMALLPDVKQVVCLECGEPYSVTWPKERQAIEDALTLRPRKNRHWFPHETIDDLTRENDQHIDVLCKTMADEGIDVTPEVAAKILRSIKGGN
jgi:hypothetical protein